MHMMPKKLFLHVFYFRTNYQLRSSCDFTVGMCASRRTAFQIRPKSTTGKWAHQPGREAHVLMVPGAAG